MLQPARSTQSQRVWAIVNPEQVTEIMGGSKSEDDWNRNIDIVKKACDGQYPDHWYATVLKSGLADRTSKAWGGDADIHIL